MVINLHDDPKILSRSDEASVRDIDGVVRLARNTNRASQRPRAVPRR